MKVAVINFSGNVGKSTLARHLLAPHMQDAQVISVESINSDATADAAIRGKQYGDLLQTLSLTDSAVVDIGASNVEDLMNQMTQYRASHEDFDCFVVPTVSKAKQQSDTISTVVALAKIGIAANKIRLVFNMVEPDETPERIFSGLFEYHANVNKFTLNPKAVIVSNDIYDRVKGTGRTIRELAEDQTDWRAKRAEAREAGDITGMEEAVDGQMDRDLAQTAQKNLAEVWKIINGTKNE